MNILTAVPQRLFIDSPVVLRIPSCPFRPRVLTQRHPARVGVLRGAEKKSE
jgi:hypothetical protein